MAGMMAVVLLLNGAQVHLPAPAVLVHGTACVPLRAVCERQGAQVTLEADGGAVVVRADGGTVRFPLATPLPSPPRAAGFTLEGVTYVSARALADALGGRCRWNAETRTVALDLPWLGGRAQRVSVDALAADAVAWHGRWVVVDARHAGGEIDWVPQDFSHDPGRTPLSARGRPLRATGPVRLDGRARAVIEAVDVVADPSHPSLSVMVAPRELTPGGAGLVTVKMSNHSASWMDVSDWPPLRVRLQGPAGQAEGISLGDGPAGLGEAHGLEAGREVSWMALWDVPEGRGREHVGVWRAIVRTPPGVPGVEGRFTVRAPQPWAVVEEAP